MSAEDPLVRKAYNLRKELNEVLRKLRMRGYQACEDTGEPVIWRRK